MVSIGFLLNREGLRQRVASTCYIAAMPADERAELLCRVESLLATLPEPIDLPYLTDAYATSRI